MLAHATSWFMLIHGSLFMVINTWTNSSRELHCENRVEHFPWWIFFGVWSHSLKCLPAAISTALFCKVTDGGILSLSHQSLEHQHNAHWAYVEIAPYTVRLYEGRTWCTIQGNQCPTQLCNANFTQWARLSEQCKIHMDCSIPATISSLACKATPAARFTVAPPKSLTVRTKPDRRQKKRNVLLWCMQYASHSATRLHPTIGQWGTWERSYNCNLKDPEKGIWHYCKNVIYGQLVLGSYPKPICTNWYTWFYIHFKKNEPSLYFFFPVFCPTSTKVHVVVYSKFLHTQSRYGVGQDAPYPPSPTRHCGCPTT